MHFFSRKTLNSVPSNTEVNTVKPGTDVAFECHAVPSTSRSLPMRRCKKENVHYKDSSSSDDSDEPDEDADKNFEETEQPNLNETTNCIQNEVENQPAQQYDYYEDDEDSDPYGYRAEMLGQNTTSSDDDDY